ncbi:hypothetical protein ACH5RR_003882 [Cinchona calisaya]
MASQINYSPYPGINVLKIDRKLLLELAEHLRLAPTYKIKVDGKPTGLKVLQNHLISNSLIIVKVDDKKVMLHGMKDGREPRKDNDLDWENIIEDDDYGWNLGTGTI